MGDILSKLQMVSEKIGVTETAHTIEEQVDLISESLDKIPASTNIAEALDDLSEVAQNINNEEVYVDKTITENGEYLPAQDEATAYSKVTVNVIGEFTTIKTILKGLDYIYIVKSANGIYDLASIIDDWNFGNVIFVDPVVKIITNGKPGVFSFTPSESYDGIYKYSSSESPFDTTGSEITPGDGAHYWTSVSPASDTLSIGKDGYWVIDVE